jgi:integrase
MLALHMERCPSGPHDLLFSKPDGSAIDPDYETDRWPAWLRESGISEGKVRLHDIRHTTVDLLYEAGVPEDVIVEIVGHSNRAMTRQYKTRGSDKRLVSAMESLSALLS